MNAEYKLPNSFKNGKRFWAVTDMKLDPAPGTHKFLWVCFVLVMLTEAAFWFAITFLMCRYLN